VSVSSKLSFTLLILICSNLFVAAEQNENNNKIKTVPLPISLDQQYKEDLKHYLPSTKVKPILVGTQEYITLINENTSPNNKGVAILIPDWQQGAVNPKAINSLRKILPKQGWTTISIQPNTKPDNFPSTALKLTEQIEENKTSIDNYKMDFSAMLNAVSGKAREYPGIVIMVAQGKNTRHSSSI